MAERTEYTIALRDLVTGPMERIAQSGMAGGAALRGFGDSLDRVDREAGGAGRELDDASAAMRRLDNATEASTRELRDESRELDRLDRSTDRAARAMNRFTRNLTAMDRVARSSQRGLRDTERSVERVGRTAQRSGSQAGGAMGMLGKVAGPIGAAMAGVFAVDRIAAFGGAVVETLGRFQTMEAVLTNTLGSGSAAKLVMKDIQDFAAVTPFQVDELTQSWVKLANDGFRPTMAQMTLLGDLAASRGKSMDDLVEAHMDAKRFEFERLKEFGVSTETQGKKLKFTFKGVTTEVDKTGAAVDKYILSLGALKGVSGGMAAISATTAGQLSNLGDKWDALKLKLGEKYEDKITTGIETMAKGLDHLSGWIDRTGPKVERLGGTFGKVFGEIGGYFGNLEREINNPDSPMGAISKLLDYVGRSLYRDSLFPNLKKDVTGLGFVAPEKFVPDVATQAFIPDQQFGGIYGMGPGAGGVMTKAATGPDPYTPDPPKPGDKSGKGDKDKASSKADRLAGVIGGGREGVKHITITIGSLIEGGVSIHTTNLREGAAKAKAMLSEALLSVANDANYAQ